MLVVAIREKNNKKTDRIILNKSNEAADYQNEGQCIKKNEIHYASNFEVY